jgi:hypothetical protein
MVSNMPSPRRRLLLVVGLIVGAGGAGFLPAGVASLAAQGSKPDVNTIRSIRSVDRAVEIELHSTREFPVRAEVVVLRIGTREFLLSRPPADGSLHTLIFTVAAEDFAAVPDGAPVVVKYGKGPDEGEPAAAAALRWTFGKLNKSQRQ